MLKHRLLLAGVFASISVLGGSHKSSLASAAWAAVPANEDACSLLTPGEVSAAIEIQSLPGKPVVPGSTKACMWTDSADASVGSRRVTLSITDSTVAFGLMKSSPRITTEPASGIGDEALYEIPKDHEAPILQVRKGGSVFTLRILNGLKAKAFTTDEVKTKEATLAKAAAGRF